MVGFRLSILYHRSLPNRSAYFMHPCFVPDNSILESDFRTYPTRFSGIPLTCRELRGCRKYNLCRSQRGRPFFRYPSPLVIHHLQPRPHAPRPATPTQAAGRSHDAHAARAANRHKNYTENHKTIANTRFVFNKQLIPIFPNYSLLFLCQFSSIFLSISEWLFLVLSFTEQICPLPILFVFPLRWLDRQSKSATSRSQRRKGSVKGGYILSCFFGGIIGGIGVLGGRGPLRGRFFVLFPLASGLLSLCFRFAPAWLNLISDGVNDPGVDALACALGCIFQLFRCETVSAVLSDSDCVPPVCLCLVPLPRRSILCIADALICRHVSTSFAG